MDAGIEFNQAAFRYGVTGADIRYAFARNIFDHAIAGEDNKYLLIGFDTNANLPEILYNVIGSRHINVFHAMKCRKAWRSPAEQQETTMARMTEAEADALDELWTKITPAIDTGKPGYFTQRMAHLVEVDGLTTACIRAKADSAHQTPAQIIGALVRREIRDAPEARPAS